MLDDQFRIDLPTYDTDNKDRMAELLRELERRFNALPQWRVGWFGLYRSVSTTSRTWQTATGAGEYVDFSTLVPYQEVIITIVTTFSAVSGGATHQGQYRYILNRGQNNQSTPATDDVGVVTVNTVNASSMYSWVVPVSTAGKNRLQFQWRSSDNVNTVTIPANKTYCRVQYLG